MYFTLYCESICILKWIVIYVAMSELDNKVLSLHSFGSFLPPFFSTLTTNLKLSSFMHQESGFK